MSQDIVTALTGSVDLSNTTGPNTEPLPQSTTLNVEQCFLCWRHAEHIYHTTAWCNFPSEERHLCRLHWLLALGVNLESKYIRAEVCEAYGLDKVEVSA